MVCCYKNILLNKSALMWLRRKSQWPIKRSMAQSTASAVYIWKCHWARHWTPDWSLGCLACHVGKCFEWSLRLERCCISTVHLPFDIWLDDSRGLDRSSHSLSFSVTLIFPPCHSDAVGHPHREPVCKEKEVGKRGTEGERGDEEAGQRKIQLYRAVSPQWRWAGTQQITMHSRRTG